MKIIQVALDSDSRIPIGTVEESNAREIHFDISRWRENYGLGSAAVLHQRPGTASAVPVTYSVDGDTVVWHVSSIDTAEAGAGYCILEYYVDNIRARSVTWQTYVMDAPSAGGGEEDDPDALKAYMEAIIKIGAEAAQSAADSAVSAGEAADSAEQAAQAAQNLKLKVNGLFDTLEELQAAFPDGDSGNLYQVVDHDREIFAFSDGAWNSLGKLEGPVGPQGPKGDTGNGVSVTHDDTADGVSVYFHDAGTGADLDSIFVRYGEKGEKGDKGDAFTVAKTYPTVAAMEADFGNADVPDGSFVAITSSVEDPDNAALYIKGTERFVFVTDLSGATGIKGDKGDTGDSGENGATFRPVVNNGVLSWVNDRELENPAAVDLVALAVAALPVYDETGQQVIEIVPNAVNRTTLNTAGKYMANDVVVPPIPVYETSNSGGGYTAVIGG